MTKRRATIITLTLAVLTTVMLSGLGVSQDLTPGALAYYLNSDSTAVMSAETGKEITSVSSMPDTVPEYLPRSRYQKFQNKKFHFLTVSPNGKYAAFAAGEGDQWVGVLAPDERYMKFLLYSIQTEFFGAEWSPDSRSLAFAYRTPDRRFVIQIVRPPSKWEDTYEPKNAWQMLRENNELLLVNGWKVDGVDTSYSFIVADSLGNEIQTIDLAASRDLSRPEGKTPPTQKKKGN